MMSDKAYFDIQVSDTCNLNCSHCCMNDSMHNREVDFKAIKSYLQSRTLVKEVHLAGGEVLLKNEDKILDLINTFPSVKWKLTTNLIYDLNPTRIEVLNKVHSLQTSFDIKIRYKNIRNLLKWFRNCQYILKNIRQDLEVICSITKYTIHKDPYKLMNFFHHMGFNGYKYILLSNAGNYTHNDLFYDKEEYHQWMNRVLDTHDYKNQTITLILNRNMTNCQYGDIVQPINIYGKEITCPILGDNNDECLLPKECMNCMNRSKCGGRCKLIPCMYYDDIYNRTVDEYIPIIAKYHDKMYK